MATASLPPGFGGALMGLPADHMGHSKPPHLRHHHLLQARVSKKVSWAAGDRLCQVRLFAAEDAPDSSGTACQDLLQAKQTKFMHATVPISSNALPPGFTPTATMSMKPAVGAVLPQVPWRVPTLFNLHPSWRVVAGGESKEVALQRQREVRVLEAVYPRTSSIPESPAEPLEPQLPFNDEMTVVIPVVPVDDDTLDQDDGLTSTVDKLHFPQESAAKDPSSKPSLPAVPPSCQTETEPDVIAAAAAAYAALSQSNDHTKIDCGLLLKFLRNPSMMKNVSSELSSKDSVENRVHEVSNLGTEGTRIGNGNQQDPAAISFPLYIPATRPTSAQLHPPLSVPPPAPQPVMPVSGRPLSQHDEQYLKDLILQHGRNSSEDDVHRGMNGRVQENVESISRSGMTRPRGKSRKACIYFNTAKGCRNGSSCVFIHDSNNVER
ncbi:unnamed protein product, partial [Sphagnum troendelagicum]